MTTNNYENIAAMADAPYGEVKVNSSPLAELGDTGLKRAAGIIDEEFLPALRGRKAIKVFREMSLNDPTVASLLFAIEQLLRQVEWTVISDDSSPKGQEAVEFVESCMEDMSHTWSDFIAEALTFITYGWSWHEIVYKKRVGPWEQDPTRRSKHTDGRFGWRKIPIRSQETLQRWIFDDDGGIKAMVQMPPPHYGTRIIPIEKSLLFRPKVSKGNPEGMSLLRGAYRPWFFKKRLEEFEAIGVERDLAGMPVARVPADFMKAKKGTDKHNTYMAFKKMVQNVRRDEHEGLVIPRQYDPETKQDLFDFELMSSGGGRTFDTNALITRYEQRILQVVLADFIMLGNNQTGSYAMHVDKTGIFRAALNAIANAIADTLNRHAIPRLFKINGWQMDVLPQIKPNNVDPPNLQELSGFMAQMSNLGMQFFPDPDLEKFLRATAHLPEIPEEQLELRRQMAGEQQFQQMMEQQFGSIGMERKAQMIQGGMTPEQAEMASQQRTPDMHEQEMTGQMVGQARAQMHPEVQQAQQAQSQQQMQQQGAMQEQRGNQELKMSEAQAKLQMKLAEEQEASQKEKALAEQEEQATAQQEQAAAQDREKRDEERPDLADIRSRVIERLKKMNPEALESKDGKAENNRSTYMKDGKG